MQLYLAKIHAGTISNPKIKKLLNPERHPFLIIHNGELALTKEETVIRQSVGRKEKATRSYAGVKRITVLDSKGKIIFSGPSDQIKRISPELTVIEEE